MAKPKFGFGPSPGSHATRWLATDVHDFTRCLETGRYLLAVNVMTASVLRGIVESALSELLAFFDIHTSVPATTAAATTPSRKGNGNDNDQHSSPERSGVDGDGVGWWLEWDWRW